MMYEIEMILPFALTVALVLAFLWGSHWLLLKRDKDLSNEKKFPRQLVMLGLTIVGIVFIALAMPVDISSRNQLIAFVGLVVSGIFAFSSTTVFANLMGGLMLRIHRPFRSGDFIRIKEHFGRVAARGLFDTEIQTETRELITIPNLYVITNPVQVMRSSGTIISGAVSLGYDVHHSVIEPLLKEAATRAGLEEPFVHITELGDFSITYRTHGLLTDVKSLLTARSELKRCILDSLHEGGVEIVSPNFMNQRPLKDGQKFIPKPVIVDQSGKEEATPTAEDIAFDKAEKAEQRELEQERLEKEIKELEEQLKEAGEEQKESLAGRIERARAALKELRKDDGKEEENQ